MPQAASSPKTFASTQGELARIFGVSRVTIMDWVQRGAPRKTGKGWDVEAMRSWREENMRPAQWTGGTDHVRSSGSDEARLLKAQADEREAKAALADLKLKLERGEIVPRKVMDDHDAAVASYFRRWALGLSKDWPPRLIGLNEKEMATVIDRQARDLLTRMARMSPTPERKEDDHEPEN